MGTYTFTAELVGSSLYVFFYNKSSTNLAVTALTSTPLELGTITITHGGKIAYMPESYLVTDMGAVVKFDNVKYADDSVTFTASVVLFINGGAQFAGSGAIPVAVNKDAY